MVIVKSSSFMSRVAISSCLCVTYVVLFKNENCVIVSVKMTSLLMKEGLLFHS